MWFCDERFAIVCYFKLIPKQDDREWIKYFLNIDKFKHEKFSMCEIHNFVYC